MNMHRFASLYSLVLCLVISSHCTAATIFDATLTGDQEVPPVTTTATGSASLILNDAEDALSYQINVFGLDIGGIKTPSDTSDDITGVHIHTGAPGTTGPVVFGIHAPRQDMDDRLITINGPSGLVQFTGIWDTPDVADGAQSLASQLAALKSGGLYINVHTVANPSGEIRGQIVPEASSLVLMALAFIGLLTGGIRRALAA